MKNHYYEVVFRATKTNQNGLETTCKKSVFMKPFENGVHVSPEEQISRGTKALKAEHYYNIEYVETKSAYIIFG